MIHHAARLIEIVAVLGTVSAAAFYLLCIASAMQFLLREKAGEGSRPTPAVSILKPLKGTDPGMYENLRSHCLQNYPEFEIIFAISDAADPAGGFVKPLQAEFPRIP